MAFDSTLHGFAVDGLCYSIFQYDHGSPFSIRWWTRCCTFCCPEESAIPFGQAHHRSGVVVLTIAATQQSQSTAMDLSKLRIMSASHIYCSSQHHSFFASAPSSPRPIVTWSPLPIQHSHVCSVSTTLS